MKTRSDSKKTEKSAATPKKTHKASTIKTPKSEKKKKKDSETPLRVDDFLSSQHFGSQIEVGWDCNSPDALRNIQRYRGQHDTELSDIVMRLLDEEPQEHSQSPDNLTRISPPPLALWRGATESVKPPRKLRPRKKSGDESSIQDTLYESLINKLQKCESISEVEEQNVSEVQQQDARESHSTEDAVPTNLELAAEGDLADEQPDKVKNLLNYSKDLFESTKINDCEDEVFGDTVVDNDKTVTKDDENQLDKSDATWSDEELFDDSFIIKATQFPETLKTFNSPLIGMKRKQSEDGLPSKSKSPRYSFQLHPKTDMNSNKFNNNLSKVRVSTANPVTAITGKPPIGLSKCASSNSATNVQMVSTVPNNMKTNNIKDKPNCGSGFTGRIVDQKGAVSGSFAGTNRTGSVVSSFTNRELAGSRQLNKQQCVKAQQSSTFTNSKAMSERTVVKSSTIAAQPSQKGSISISKNSSFRKHNSFNGQESPKSGSPTLTRQRSFSGASNNSCIAPTSSATTCNLETVPVSNAKFPYMSASKSGSNSLNKPTVTSFYSKSKPCATVTPIACSMPLPVNNARNTKPLCSNGTRTGPTCLNASKASTFSSSVSNAVKSVGYSAFKGQSILESSATMSRNTVLASKAGSLASTVSNTSTLVRNCSKSDSTSSLSRVKQSKLVEDPFKESPVFGAKKRLSSSAFDTSLTDELLCKLAEPDDLFESQVCDSTIKPDVKQTSSNNVVSASSHSIPSASRTSNVLTVSKPVTKTVTVTTLKQNNSKVNPVNSTVIPAKTDEKRSYSFKTSQKPTVGVRQGDINQAGDIKTEGQQSSTVFRKPVTSPEKTKTKTPAPVLDHNVYSEDLFDSDDDFMEDDGLTEPEILAMLDEVEYLATQRMKTNQEVQNKDQAMNRNDLDQLSPPCTPTKYSPSDIEKKKQEALKRKEMSSQRLSSSQEAKTNFQSYFSPEKRDPLSQGKSPIKCSPEDIEKKRQQALKRRQTNKAAQQLNFSQEPKTSAGASCIVGQSPTKDLPLSQGGSSSQSNSDKDFDNSQGNLSSPTKYSPAEIERKRLEARKKLSSSQELKLIHGHSPSKDLPLSQGQTFSQWSNDGCNSTQIQPSPVKYSQVDIERKKQEALKRRKLKLTGVQRK